MQPAPGLTLYNPDLLPKADLIRGFVVRGPLLEELLDDLRRTGTSDASQHHLLMGQRGLGKTTLLRRIAYAIDDDQELRAVWMPLIFPEEQYNVSSLADFWLNCCDALSDALEFTGRATESRRLDEELEKVARGDSAAALSTLVEEAGRLDRRLLLLVDNIDVVLDRISQDEEWEFRRTLSEQHSLTIIGASSKAMEAFHDHGRAFYEFFQVHPLEGLTDDEAFLLLRHLAEQTSTPQILQLLESERSRVRTLRELTAGNPRTLVLLFQVLRRGPDGDVQNDLEQLLDLYTPLYKARFEELPQQAQKIVDAMALHWDPITAAGVESETGLPVNGVSAQLNRLQELGVVEKVEWFGEKKTGFQIAERFFNIWYLMRASRRVRRKLMWLVKFMQAWFTEDELRQRAAAHLACGPEQLGRERYAELSFAYAQMAPGARMRMSLEHAGLRTIMEDDAVRRNIDLSDLPPALLDKKERMEKMRELADRVPRARKDWGGIDPRGFWSVLGGSPDYTVAEKEKVVEELDALAADKFAELDGQLRDKRFRMDRAFGEEVVGQLYGAFARGEIADVFDWESAAAIGGGRLVRAALGSRFHRELNRASEAEVIRAQEVCRELIAEPDLAAAGWLGQGNLLRVHLNRHSEAEQAYRKAIELDPKYAPPWSNLGVLLSKHLNRQEEAEQAFRGAIELDPKYARAWNNLGFLLTVYLNRHEDAEQAYRSAIELDPKDALAWKNLGNLLAEYLNRHEEAKQAYRRAIELDPKDAPAWNNLGIVLAAHLNRHEEAEQAFRKAIELDPMSAPAWSNLGPLLTDLNRHEEAKQAWRKAIELDPKLVFPWSNLGRVLRADASRQLEAAEALLRAVELDHTRKFDQSALLQTIQQIAAKPDTSASAPDLARRAVALLPDNQDAAFVFAETLVRTNRWHEAPPIIEPILADAKATPGRYATSFCAATVAASHTRDLLDFFKRTGADERWRPLYEALRAVEAGDSKYLRRVAPEVRRIARSLLETIAPHLLEQENQPRRKNKAGAG